MIIIIVINIIIIIIIIIIINIVIIIIIIISGNMRLKISTLNSRSRDLSRDCVETFDGSFGVF